MRSVELSSATRFLLPGLFLVSTLAADWVAKESEEWRPLLESPLLVAKGTALDFGEDFDAPAGRHGRVIATPEGFAFEKDPSRRIRFFGCGVSPRDVFRPETTREEVRAYAEGIRRQGYNLVRYHFLDHALTTDAKEAFAFDEVVWDRMAYFFACLKELGIYLYLDAVTSWRGFEAGSGWTAEAKKFEYHNRIFSEEAAREHWRRGVREILTRRNPHTGTTFGEDPAVAIVLAFNEQNLNFWKPIPAALGAPWRAWLARRYGSVAALRKAWAADPKPSALGEIADFESIPLFTSKEVTVDDAKGRDLGLFLFDLHRDQYRWFETELRAMGYGGEVSQYDWLNHLGMHAARVDVPVISMHGYHAHPSSFLSKGSKVSQESAVESTGRLFGGFAMSRWSDRPFFVTEYGVVFWNRHRYEEGLLMGAYSALQGFDGLMAHQLPVFFGARETIKPFLVGLDPVARASQVQSFLAWKRGDVRASARHVEITLRKESVFGENKHSQGIGADQGRLSLLSRVGLRLEGERGRGTPRASDVRLPVFGTGEMRVKDAFAEVVDAGGGAEPLVRAVATLRKAGVLGEGNRTDVAKGVYESDTREILLDGPRRRLEVRSDRLAGVCLDPSVGESSAEVGVLGLSAWSAPASVSLASLDGRSLAESRRCLLVVATDALNEGMAFTGPDREVLVSNGNAKPLLRAVKGSLRFRFATTAGWKAWALRLDGTRASPLVLREEQGALALELNTAEGEGATPFFELVQGP